LVDWLGDLMKLITAVVKPQRVHAIKDALHEAGISGITVTQVDGFGRQKGHTEVYRGASVTVDFVAKAKLEILVSDGDVQRITEVIIASANTGSIGDGKIWVTSVDEVIRVRTNERGDAAI
jgi:nitrogen regulatory protein P-II 1